MTVLKIPTVGRSDQEPVPALRMALLIMSPRAMCFEASDKSRSVLFELPLFNTTDEE